MHPWISEGRALPLIYDDVYLAGASYMTVCLLPSTFSAGVGGTAEHHQRRRRDLASRVLLHSKPRALFRAK